MFSSDSHLTEEQSRILNDVVNQVHALQESIPAQLEGFSNTLNQVETNINEKLNEEVTFVMAQAEVAIKNLGAEIQEFMDNHVVLKANLHEEQQRVAALHPEANPTAATPDAPIHSKDGASTSLKVKEPNVFSGKSMYCNAFFSQLALVFASNPARFHADRAKLLYAISYMGGVAFQYMEPYLQKLDSDDPPAILDDYNLFKKTITLAFGDNHPIINAEASIRSLKHTSSVSNYVTEFRRLAMQLKWNDEAFISQFKLNLKEFIIKEVARRGTAHATLDEIMNEAIEVDNLFYSVNKTHGSSNHNNSNHHHNHQKHHHKQTQYKNQHQKHFRPKYPRYNNNAVNMHQQQTSSNNNNTAPTPMELGAVNQHKPLTQADKEFRKANGLCLYCGSKDHILRDCNRKKPITRISNSISLIKEGDTPVDLAAVTPLTSKKRKLPTEFLEVGEIKLIAKSKYQSIMVIPITAYHGPNEEEATRTDALIDTGAIHNFVSLEWADYLGIPIEKFAPGQQRTYRLADGSEYICKAFCAMTFRIDNTHHVKSTVFHILETCSFHAILGVEWIKRHNPLLCFQEPSNHLKMNCLTTRCTPVQMDTPSPAGLLLSQPSVTTALVTTPPSEDVEMARSPQTTAITFLRALVADRPPTPYPSSTTMQPAEENWYVNPAMLDTNWLPADEATSYDWNDTAWVEQLFQQQLELPSTQDEFTEDPSTLEPAAETEDEDDDQEVDEDDDDDDDEAYSIHTVPRPRRTLNINQIRPSPSSPITPLMMPRASSLSWLDTIKSARTLTPSLLLQLLQLLSRYLSSRLTLSATLVRPVIPPMMINILLILVRLG